MAAISSNIGVGLVNPVWDFTATTTWIGGIVPGPDDDVTINATRTTINQSAINKWVGTTTITVASNAGFASTGSFYCGTSWGEVLKIDYAATATTTQFIGCSIDESLPEYAWSQGGNIPNTSYVHAPAPIITVPVNSTTSVKSLLIQNGGWFSVPPGATFKSTTTVTLRDGRFVARGNTGTTATIQISANETYGIGNFTTENYQMSILDCQGAETRAWGTTTSYISTGSTFFTVNMNTGTFARDDEISVYDDSPVAQRRRIQVTFRDTVQNYKNMDEGYDVTGVWGSNVYFARRNGARANIVSISTVTTGQQILKVDKNSFRNQNAFRAGDIVVINSGTYTISAVRDSQYELGYYNFQSTGTFTDFIANEDISVESAWSRDAYGAYASNASWNALVNKRSEFWRREMSMEVEMSPWTQYYSAGTRGTNYYGLVWQYDPMWRKGHRTQYDTVKNGYWRIYDAGDTILIAEKATGANDYQNMSLDSAGLRTILQAPAVLKVDIRNNIIKCSVNGEQIYERFQNSMGHRGLWGVFSADSNPRVKSIRYSAPTQDLFINTTTTFTVGDTVYESGAEWDHSQGNRVVKLASKVASPAAHDDYAFAFRGAYDQGSWPIVRGINTNTSTSSAAGWIQQHDMGIDYYIDMGTGVLKNVVMDLGQTRTFTHVSFTPRTEEMGTNPFMKAVSIDGSADGTNWTNIYATADDTKRYQNGSWYNQIGYYSVGTRSYRYVRFGTGGHGGTSNTTYNRYVNVGVHDFTAGYTLTLNNASDFQVGDSVTVMHHMGWYNNEDVGQYQAVKATSMPETYFHSAYNYRTITAVNGNTITLDGPVNWGYIEGGESVVKISRPVVFRGYFDNQSAANGGNRWQKPYFRYNQGTSTPRRYWLKNTQFLHVGSSRVSSSSFNRGIDLATQDYNNPALVDGCSFENYNNSDANGLTFQSGLAIVRNNFIGAMRDYRPYYLASYCGVATMNNKFFNCFYNRAEGQKHYIFNFNEVSSAYQFHQFNAFGADGYVTPHEYQVRRNLFHGNRDVAYYGDNNFDSIALCPIIRHEYNKYYGSNVTPFTTRSGGHRLEQQLGTDVSAGHPGHRLNQYRSDNPLNWYTWNNWSSPGTGIEYFGRHDYYHAYVGNAYHTIVKYYGNDYARLYASVVDGQIAVASIQVYKKTVSNLKIYIEIEYRHPMRYNRLQNGNWDNGRFRIGVTANAAYAAGTPVYTTLPTTDAWTRYANTFTVTTATTGVITAWAGRGNSTSFADIRFMRAYIMTDDPENTFVVHNTFDVSKYTSMGLDDKKGMQQYTTTNVARVLQLKL